MNAPTQRAESTALTVATQQSANLMLNHEVMTQMMAVAEAMATASITVPMHFRGQPGDCLAVVMQATQWNMNPFAVAQKTHVVNGTLGYEAQLVNAVLEATGAIEGTFKYEYRNEGTPSLECRVGAVCRGDSGVTWNEWLSAASVTTKNSPLWKTNPKQQMGYLQVKNWARAFKPGAILGVYTTDELAPAPAPEKNMGPADVVAQPTGAATAGTASEVTPLPEFTEEHLKQRVVKIAEFYTAGKTADEIIEFYAKKATIPDAMKARIRGMDPKAPAAEGVTDATPKVTYAALADRLQKCGDADTAALILDEGRALPADQLTDLTKLHAEKFGKGE